MTSEKSSAKISQRSHKTNKIYDSDKKTNSTSPKKGKSITQEVNNGRYKLSSSSSSNKHTSRKYDDDDDDLETSLKSPKYHADSLTSFEKSPAKMSPRLRKQNKMYDSDWETSVSFKKGNSNTPKKNYQRYETSRLSSKHTETPKSSNKLKPAETPVSKKVTMPLPYYIIVSLF